MRPSPCVSTVVRVLPSREDTAAKRLYSDELRTETVQRQPHGGCNMSEETKVNAETGSQNTPWQPSTHMRTRVRRRCGLACVYAFLFLAVTSSAWANTWRGTAPFCNGQCQSGERQLATSKCGDGGCCWTGQKALCSNSTPLCASLQTHTQCFGVVLICQNGHYEAASQWVTCSQYACGACLGFGSS